MCALSLEKKRNSCPKINQSLPRYSSNWAKAVQLNLETCWGFVCLYFVVVLSLYFVVVLTFQVWNYWKLLLEVCCSQAARFLWGFFFPSFFLLKYFYVSICFTIQFYLFMVYCFSVFAYWTEYLQMLMHFGPDVLPRVSFPTHDSSILNKEDRAFHTWLQP